MDIVSGRAAKSLRGAEPFMEGRVKGHFFPIYIALATREDINLVVSEERSEIHSLGVVEGIDWEARHVRVAEMKTVGA